MPNIFTSLEHINWTRYWFIIGTIVILWIGLAEIVPLSVYKPVSVILQAIQGALLFAARSSKYAEGSTPPPQDGKP